MSEKVLLRAVFGLLLVGGIFSVTGCMMESAPVADNFATSRKLENLPRHQGPKKTVMIYEFKSEVP